MNPCIFVACPVLDAVLGSLHQHLKRLLGQREDRWLFAGTIVSAANAGTRSQRLSSLII